MIFPSTNRAELQIQQNRQDERAAGGLFIEELGDGVAQVLCLGAYY